MLPVLLEEIHRQGEPMITIRGSRRSTVRCIGLSPSLLMSRRPGLGTTWFEVRERRVSV